MEGLLLIAALVLVCLYGVGLYWAGFVPGLFVFVLTALLAIYLWPLAAMVALTVAVYGIKRSLQPA